MIRAVVLVVGVAMVGLTARPPAVASRSSDFRPLLLRPSVARTISRPWLPMLVELLWLRALNAIGQPDSLSKNLALSEYGQTITDLDPRFYQAYQYIGLNVPYNVERTWTGGDRASALFRKGLKTFPQDLRLHLYLGFSLMHHERKFSEAGDVFAAAALLPDALPFMAALATRLKAHGGDADSALELAKQLALNAQDEAQREELAQRVEDLEVEVQLQRVDRALAQYRSQHPDRGVPALSTLVSSGHYDGPTNDARGGVIYIRESDGKVLSTSLDRRLELYE